MKWINTTLFGSAFIGLMGCSSDSLITKMDQYTYNGKDYAIVQQQDAGSFGGATNLGDPDLYVCRNGKWQLVNYMVKKNIGLIQKYGKSKFSSEIHLASINGSPCTQPPKQPKAKVKDHIVVDEVTTVPKVPKKEERQAGD